MALDILPSVSAHDLGSIPTSHPHNLPRKTDALHDVIHSIQPSIDDLDYQMNNLQGHRHDLRLVCISDGRRFMLKTAPPSRTTLLRHELHSLSTEAFVFSLLAKSKLPVPHLLHYDSNSAQLGSPFLLTTHLPGISYASVRQYLTSSERSCIERQLKSLVSIVSQHSSSKFGPVILKKGYKTWREAFLAMLESVLMDGEDKLVNLPYGKVRAEALRFGHSLDDVEEARLVIFNFGSPENVLVNRRTNEITGLTDFGRAIWGDPTMLNTDRYTGPKRLLYICYMALVDVVTNHYRTSNDAEELDARRLLTTALMELSAMET